MDTSISYSNYNWHSPTKLIYYYQNFFINGYLGNYYSGHDHTDIDKDGITDSVYALPSNVLNDEYPLATVSIIDSFIDLDGDDFSIADGDCDDTNELITPTAPEACNGIDDN